MRTHSVPRVAFLTALAWAACLTLVPYLAARVIDWILALFVAGFTSENPERFASVLISPTLGGAAAGYLMAWTWQRTAGLRALRPLDFVPVGAAVVFLGVVLGIALSGVFLNIQPVEPVSALEGYVKPMPPLLPLFANGGLVWLAPGALGGVLAARWLRAAGVMLHSRWAMTAAGWALGFSLGGGVSKVLVALYFWSVTRNPGMLVFELAYWLSLALTGGIGSLAGAWVLLRAARPAAVDAQALPGAEAPRA